MWDWQKSLLVQGCGFSFLFAQLHNKSCSRVTSINGVYQGRFRWPLFKMEHPQGLTSMSSLLVAITCPTHVSHKELHLKKPSAELGVQNSPTIKNSSVLPFQVESSNPLFGCSELDLQSLSMIPCSIGWTIPKRGRWEESPSQQASISCQHSSSNTGRRSGRTPGKWRGTWLPSVQLKSESSFVWCSLLWCRLKWPTWTAWGLMLLIKAYISAMLLRHHWEHCCSRSGDHAHFQRMANTFSFTGASSLQLFGSKINTLPSKKKSPPHATCS